MSTPIPRRDPVTMLRALLLIAGLAMLAWAGWLLVTHLTLPQLWPVTRWALGAVVLHDAVVAPAAVVVGWLVLRHSPVRWRAALRAALLCGFCVMVMSLVLTGARAHQQNPTVAVNTPGTSLVLALVLVPVVTAAIALASRRRRSSAAAATATRSAPGPVN